MGRFFIVVKIDRHKFMNIMKKSVIGRHCVQPADTFDFIWGRYGW